MDDLGKTGLRLDRHDFSTRNHDFARRHFRELEDVVDQLFFVFLEMARLVAEINQMADLVFGIGRVMTGPEFDSEEPEKLDTGNIDEPDEWLESAIEEIHPAGRGHRESLGLLDRERL